MSLSDEIRKKKDRLKAAVAQVGELVAFKAAETYAPKGPNFPSELSLAKQIVPLKVRKEGNRFVCLVVSSARSRSGFDYAEKQHNNPNLRHSQNPPGGTSFADFGHGNTREDRYRTGLAEAVGASKFATQYLKKAADFVRFSAVHIIKAALK